MKKWNKWPSWLKSGIVTMMIGIILFFIGLILIYVDIWINGNTNSIFSIIGFILFFIFTWPMYLFNNEKIILISYIISLGLLFGIGAIVNIILKRILAKKSKRNKK
jgi:hypothetical protein